MKKLFLYILIVSFFHNTSHAKSLVYSKYKKSQNEEDVIQHILSVESGMSWMQIWSKKELYCKPGKLKMNIQTAKDAIELGVEDFKLRNFSTQKINDAPVEVVLIEGLKILFPCN